MKLCYTSERRFRVLKYLVEQFNLTAEDARFREQLCCAEHRHLEVVSYLVESLKLWFNL